MKNYEIEQIVNLKKKKFHIQARSIEEAQKIAMSKHLGRIIKIKETKPPFNLQTIKDKFKNYSSINQQNLIASIRQIYVMTNAGISIHDSIQEAAISTSDHRLAFIFNSIANDLNAGMSLTECMMTHKNELGSVVIALVRLGENTGNISSALKKLAEILQDIDENKRKFKKAIRYPITVLIAICIAFSVLMLFVVPQFREIFNDLNAQLPLPTIMLLQIQEIVSDYGLVIILFIICLIYIIRWIYNSNRKFKMHMDGYLLKIYLINKIIFFSSMYRFNLIFAELIRAGIPIEEALTISCKTITNSSLAAKMLMVKTRIQAGNALASSLRDTNLYEGMLIQMVAASEKGGSLDEMLIKIMEYYKEKFDDVIDNISSYIEPILLVFMAGMIVLIALGIFMPMWDLASAVRG